MREELQWLPKFVALRKFMSAAQAAAKWHTWSLAGTSDLSKSPFLYILNITQGGPGSYHDSNKDYSTI